MNVKFVAGFPLILHSLDSGRDICESRLGLLVRSEGDDQVVELRGVNHLGLRTFACTARSMFCVDGWPADIPRPLATLEPDVEDVSCRSL